MASKRFSFVSPITQSGDDVYLKAVRDGNNDDVWDEDNWGDHVLFLPEVGTSNTYSAIIDDVTIYNAYRNTHSVVFTADSASDTLTSTAHGLSNSYSVLVRGADLPGGLSQSTTYYVVGATTNTFQLSTSDGGAAVSLSDDGSGAMTATALELRSTADKEAGFLFTVNRESEPETLAGEGQVSREQSILANINTILSDLADGGRLDLLIDAILEDSNELQTDWANGGRLDLLLDAIQAKVNTIGTAQAVVVSPVGVSGLLSDIISGDDYKIVNGRQYVWTITDPGNVTPATATCSFGGKRRSERSGPTWLVSGEVADAGGGELTLTFELDDTDTEPLTCGTYDWSVELVDDSGNEITVAKATVDVVEKQT